MTHMIWPAILFAAAIVASLVCIAALVRYATYLISPEKTNVEYTRVMFSTFMGAGVLWGLFYLFY
jgi:hypothetical protein